MRLISLLTLFLDSGTQFYKDVPVDAFTDFIPRLTAPIQIAQQLPDQFFSLPGPRSAQVEMSNVAVDSGTEGPTVSQITSTEELLGVRARVRLYDLDSQSVFLEINGTVSEVTRLTQSEAAFTVTTDDEADRQTLLPKRRLLDIFPNADLNGSDEKTAIGVVFGTTRKATLVQTAENDYFTCTFTHTGAEPDKFLFADMTSISNYVVSAGDTLIYDVQWREADAFVALDLEASDGTSLRASGATDQNGLGLQPFVDLSAKTTNVPAWYRREIILPASLHGKTITRFTIASQHDVDGSRIGRIGRAKIVNAGGALTKTIIGVGSPNPTLDLFLTSNAGNSVTIVNHAPASDFGALRIPESGTLTIENVYRNGALVDPSEYTVLERMNAFAPGYKVVSFSVPQRTANGELPVIQVDVTTTEFNDNPANALKFLMEDATYGLGRPTNATAFTAARDAYTAAAIEVGAGVFVQEPAGDLIPQLLFNGAVIDRKSNGDWTLTVDTESLHTAGPINLGQDDEEGWENFEPTDAAPVSTSTRVAQLTVLGVLDPGFSNRGEAWLVRTTRTRSVAGIERELRLRFAKDIATVDREAHYLWEQLTSQDRQLAGTVPVTEPDLETLQVNDLLTVTVPNLLIFSETFLLRGLSTQRGAIELRLSGYSAASYTYAAGTDQFVDPRALALTDTSQTLPAQPTNFSNTAPITTIASTGLVESLVQVEADAPATNVSSLIFRAIKAVGAASRDEAEVVVSLGQKDVQALLQLKPGLTSDLEVFAYNSQNDPGFQAGIVASITGVVPPSDTDIPTNVPDPSGLTFVLNADGSMDVTLTWQPYVQAAVPADRLMVFSISGAGPLSPPVATDFAAHLNPGVTAYTFRGLNPGTNYRFGIAAARQPATGGFAITAVQSPTASPDWADISAVGNYTGNINGTAAATVVVNAADGKTAFDGTIEWRSAGAPTNQPVPNVIVTSVNPDGSFDILAGWTYDNTTGARKASEFLFFWETGALPVTSSPHVTVGAVFNATTTYTVRIEGIAQDTVLSLGVIAVRTYEGNRQAGLMVTSDEPPDWKDVTIGTPNYTGNIDGTAAATVVINADDGKTAFDGTIEWRSAGAPTNQPVPNVIVTSVNPDGSFDILAGWTYDNTTGARKASEFLFFWETGALPVTSSPHVTVGAVFNATTTYTVRIEGIAQDTVLSLGVIAVRTYEGNRQAGLMVTSDEPPDWKDVTIGTPNYTGNIDGTAAATVVINADDGKTAFDDTVNFRAVDPPTNDIVPTELLSSVNPDGSVDYRVGFTYTQGALRATTFYFFWNEGSAPTTASPHVEVGAIPGSSTYRVSLVGVAQDTELYFNVRAARETSFDTRVGPPITSTTDPDWEAVTIGTPNYTANLNGTAAATVVANATDGKTAFDGTPNFRSGLGPTNNPSPDGLLVVVNSNGIAVDYTLIFDYTQGARPAKGFFVFVAQGNVTPVFADPHFELAAQKSGTFQVAIALQGYPIDDVLSFGVAAFTQSDNGLEINGMITSNSDPDWQGISSGTPSFTGPIFGVEQHNFEARSTGSSANEHPNIGVFKDGAALTWPSADLRYGNGGGNITLGGGFDVLVYDLINKSVEYAHKFATRALNAETFDNGDILIPRNNGSPTQQTTSGIGKFGRSFLSNAGSATRAMIGTNGAFSRFSSMRSVEFWVHTTGTGPVVVISPNNDAAAHANTILVAEINASGKFVARIHDAGGSNVFLVSSTTVNDGTFHHLAAHITSAGSFCLYVDGIREGLTTDAAFTDWDNAAPTEAKYLHLFHHAGANFSGEIRIDELAYAQSTWQANSTSDFTPQIREYQDTWPNVNPTGAGLWHFQERAGANWYSALRPARAMFELITKYDQRSEFSGQDGFNFAIIVMAGFDAASGRTAENLSQAIARIGGSQALWLSSQWQQQAAYVLVGQTLAQEGGGLERYAGQSAADNQAYAFVSFQTQDDKIVGLAGKGWQPTQTPGVPTNNPSPVSVVTTGRPSGSTVIEIFWSYTQPSFSGENRPADFLEVGVLDGNTGVFDINGVQAFKVTVAKTGFRWESPFQQTWSFAIRSGRYSANGEEVGPWQTSGSDPDWHGIGGTTQITSPGIGDGEVPGPKIPDDSLDTGHYKNLSIVNAKIGNVGADKITTALLTVNPSSGGATAIFVTNAGKIRMQSLVSSPATIAFENSSQVEQVRISGGTLPDLRIEPTTSGTGGLDIGRSTNQWAFVEVRSGFIRLQSSGQLELNAGNVFLKSPLRSDQVEASAPPGSPNQRLPVFNQAGTHIGYFAIHPTS